MKKIVMIALVLAAATVARAFDFSAPATTGQTLYYTITSSTTVKLVDPEWDSYTRPSGTLVVPPTVQNGSTTYNVTEVDRRAFFGCGSITRIVLPEGLTTIGSLAFVQCTALDTIELPSTLTLIANEAFNGCGYYATAENWENGTLLYIDNYLIKANNTLAGSYVLREGTAGIAGLAFRSCHDLVKVELSEALRFIGPNAFSDCTALDTLKATSTTPPTLGDDCFEYIPSLTVAVPCGAAANYSGGGWAGLDVVEYGCNGIADVMPASGVRAAVADGVLTLTFDEATDYRVSDVMGRQLAAGRSSGGETVRLSLPAWGIYVVSAGAKALKISYSK